jgi:transcriptional regulator of acetoin/glycerol metabolism
MAPDGTIRPADLALRSGGAGPGRIEDLTLEEVEKLVIQKALSRFDGNVSQAAKALGLSRSALYRRLETHEI